MPAVRLPSSVRIGQVAVTCKPASSRPCRKVSQPVDAIPSSLDLGRLERVEDRRGNVGQLTLGDAREDSAMPDSKCSLRRSPSTGAVLVRDEFLGLRRQQRGALVGPDVREDSAGATRRRSRRGRRSRCCRSTADRSTRRSADLAHTCTRVALLDTRPSCRQAAVDGLRRPSRPSPIQLPVDSRTGCPRRSPTSSESPAGANSVPNRLATCCPSCRVVDQ